MVTSLSKVSFPTAAVNSEWLASWVSSVEFLFSNSMDNYLPWNCMQQETILSE
jgi:hypothetical protein